MGSSALKQGHDPVGRLQTRRQQLQNQMLLLNATGTDTAGAPEEVREELETALEKVAAELQAAKTDPARLSGTPEVQSAAGPRMDTYEAGKRDAASYGGYRRIPDEENGWQVLFSPYEEGREPDGKA